MSDIVRNLFNMALIKQNLKHENINTAPAIAAKALLKHSQVEYPKSLSKYEQNRYIHTCRWPRYKAILPSSWDEFKSSFQLDSKLKQILTIRFALRADVNRKLPSPL